MIYTVTFNPSLDYVVEVKEFTLGKTNRTRSENIFPGGKGINVSVVLSNLGIDSTALGFVAGFTGKELVNRVARTGIRCDFIEAKEGITRINVKLKNYESTEINGIGPDISFEEIGHIYEKLERCVAGDIVVLAGSIPAFFGMNQDIRPEYLYADIMSHLSDRGVRFVVDATGELLRNTLQWHPFMIKPNKDELGELFGTNIESREDIIRYAKELQRMGAVNVLVSLGEDGAVLVAENGEVYSEEAPEGTYVNGVGAGDSMVAGFIAGYTRSESVIESFKMSVAAGSATAFAEGLADYDAIMRLFHRLQ